MVRVWATASADGVVCEHIPDPVIRNVDGILYCNDGDWIENCTALVENGLGRLELIAWTECAGESSLAPPRNLPAMAPVRDRVREPALST